jgi:hypothetical protein
VQGSFNVIAKSATLKSAMSAHAIYTGHAANSYKVCASDYFEAARMRATPVIRAQVSVEDR